MAVLISTRSPYRTPYSCSQNILDPPSPCVHRSVATARRSHGVLVIPLVNLDINVQVQCSDDILIRQRLVNRRHTIRRLSRLEARNQR